MTKMKTAHPFLARTVVLAATLTGLSSCLATSHEVRGATALGRPLIAKLMVDAAKEHQAKAVAHGCTGKGNDQVRFDVTFQTLAPHLKIIAPVREWRMTRDEEIKYAHIHGIPVEATKESQASWKPQKLPMARRTQA